MMTVRQEPPNTEDSPIAWCCELLHTHDRGQYKRAIECQGQLERLGWQMRRRTRKSRDQLEPTTSHPILPISEILLADHRKDREQVKESTAELARHGWILKRIGRRKSR